MLIGEERCLSAWGVSRVHCSGWMLRECCSLKISVQGIKHIHRLKDIREVHVIIETWNDPHKFTFRMLVPKLLVLFEKAVESLGDRIKWRKQITCASPWEDIILSHFQAHSTSWSTMMWTTFHTCPTAMIWASAPHPSCHDELKPWTIINLSYLKLYLPGTVITVTQKSLMWYTFAVL